jgi:hypothetical protein
MKPYMKVTVKTAQEILAPIISSKVNYWNSMNGCTLYCDLKNVDK